MIVIFVANVAVIVGFIGWLRDEFSIARVLLMIETRPREFAEQIGKRMREYLREQVKDVPEQYRDQVLDLTINGLAIGWHKSRSKRK